MKKFTKTGKVLLCLTLAASMVTGLLILGARQNWATTELGALSQYYEIGSVDGKGDPGYVSTVDGDSGGTSFGIYMFASKAGTPVNFAQWLSDSENAVYQDMGDQLLRAYNYNSKGEYYPGYGSNFTNTWKNIAEENKSGFYEAQKAFWQDKYYDGLVSWAKDAYGLDVNNYSDALKNVFWSRSVQHGLEGAKKVIGRAIENRLNGFTYQPEADLISAIYAESGKLADDHETKMTGALAEKYGVEGQSLAYYSANSGGVQMSVYRRLRVNEPHDALTMLYQKRNGDLLSDGTYVLRDYLSENQSRVLFDSGVVDASNAENAGSQKMVLTWYQSGSESGFYTIAAGDKRLSDSKDHGVIFANPSTSRRQHWVVEDHAEGGRILKNVSTEQYLTINAETKKLGTTDDMAKAARWQFSAQNAVTLRDAILPTEDNKLTVGSSGFPVRGIVTCALPMTNVTVTVKNSGDVVAFQASSGKVSTNYFDLWELDDKSKFSKLGEGDYTLVVTATVSGDSAPQTLLTSTFSVAPAPTEPEDVAKETFTVTVDAAGGECEVIRIKYELGAVYGELPEATKADGQFQGWFLSDGTQITASTPVAAEDHTITAKYGDLYTVTFKSENGSKDIVQKLGEGELIQAPANPLKAPDSQYKYTFSHWADAAGNQFKADTTFMGKADVTYTAIYNKTELPTQPTTPPDSGTTTPPDGGTTTPPDGGNSGDSSGGSSGGNTGTSKPVDGGYLSGIGLKTDVSTLIASGYTVYSGGKQVTSGMVGTGMTAVANNVSTTIVVTGDVSGDGKITITDVVKLQSSVVGKTTLSGAYGQAADVSGDGKVTITDVVQAAQYTVGKRTFN